MAPNCLKCGVRRELVAVTPAPHRYEIGTYRCPVCASTERLAQRSRVVSLSIKRRVRDGQAEADGAAGAKSKLSSKKASAA
jgi:hypothetical protein